MLDSYNTFVLYFEYQNAADLMIITKAGHSYNFASDQQCADAVRDSK